MALRKSDVLAVQKRLQEQIDTLTLDIIAKQADYHPEFTVYLFSAYTFPRASLERDSENGSDCIFAPFDSKERSYVLHKEREMHNAENAIMNQIDHVLHVGNVTKADPEITTSDLKEIAEKYVGCFKIHLLLSPRQLFDNLKTLHDALPHLAHLIRGFKYCWYKVAQSDPRYEIPTVVFYCRPNRRCAQLALDRIVQLFGHLPMLQKPPMYNIHVRGPVFYAGGNRDSKKEVLKNYGVPYLDILWQKQYNYALYTGQEPLDLFKLESRL